MTNNLCVIPARGGSKRIPRKNIKNFFGKPMLAYPIQAALASGLFSKVIVSTDDEEIAEVALKYGADVPFMRPAELADDFATTAPVIKHAVNFLQEQGESYANLSFIYPCTPLITAQVLQTAYAAWQASRAEACMAVCEFPAAPQRGLIVTANNRLESLYPEYRATRTQDLPAVYYDAGQFYFANTQAYLQGLGMHSNRTFPFILPRHLAQDIDTPEDWQQAELLYQLLQQASIN